jgi:hypothetical protein
MSVESAINNEPAPSESVPTFDIEAISLLSDDQIHHSMTVEELIGVIRSVEYPFAGKDRLEYFDRDTLERVVCLVRRWSCHRLGKLSL